MQRRQHSHSMPTLLRMLASSLLMALALEVSLHYLCSPLTLVSRECSIRITDSTNPAYSTTAANDKFLGQVLCRH
jgi:hypothetical protein